MTRCFRISGAVCVLACVWATALSRAEEPWLVYAATRVDKAPVIDGRLDDPCWQTRERTRPLTCIGGAPATVSTTGTACWDDQNLYLALMCAEPHMAVIQQDQAAGRLGPFEESVEIFVDAVHDRFSYLQFRVDIMGRRDTHTGPDPDKSLDECWTGAVAQYPDHWTVELAIPWSTLASGRPEEQTVWGLNLNRCRSVSPECGWTCWSDTKGPFHSPSRFGNLVFFPYREFLRGYFSGAFRSADDEIERLSRRSRTSAVRFERQRAAIANENGKFLEAVASTALACGQDAAAPYARGLEQQRQLESLRDQLLLEVIKDLAAAAERQR